jgi:diguanylate cyclase
VLHFHGAHPGWWVLLALYAFAWPHLAYAIVKREPRPQQAELRNLLVDSAMGGLWVAVMQFSLLPSVLLVTMLSVDKLGVGGVRLLGWTSLVLVAACAGTSALLGFPLRFETPMSVIVGCLPLLVAYPIAISSVTYSLRIRVARQNKRLAELGRTDPLTGLANRRQSLAMVEAEFARCGRSGHPATLMMIDIDRFKSVNDRYGHPVGDDVLRGVAAILRGCCRASDTPSRYGGDEFLIVLPDTDVARAAVVAERIRQRCSAFRCERVPELRLTVSVGAAEPGSEMREADAWIQKADAALYEAKATGRDRFVGVVPRAAASSPGGARFARSSG